MLELDSPEWSRLRHAYGSSADVPDLIRRLQRDPSDAEAWEGVWSSLCHQFDVYEATYAALPHVVGIMRGVPARDRVDVAQFIGFSVVCSARATAPRVPANLAESYDAALHEADRLLLESLSYRGWNEDEYMVLFGALAAIRGEAALALDIFEAGGERSCPQCGATIQPHSAEILIGKA